MPTGLHVPPVWPSRVTGDIVIHHVVSEWDARCSHVTGALGRLRNTSGTSTQAGETSTITGIISNAAMMDDKAKKEGFFLAL